MMCHVLFFFFYFSGAHLDLHSFPTRRSSDLCNPVESTRAGHQQVAGLILGNGMRREAREDPRHAVAEDQTGNLLVTDRKSTRLNSSHSQISYAVFCLKKKKKKKKNKKHIYNE